MKNDSSREPLQKHSVDVPTVDSPIHMPPPGYAPDGYDDSIHSDDEESVLDPADCAQDEWHEERQTRETWDGKLDFILSCIGYAVGLGNVWRFPYLCYTNGGGAFLIPYFTFLILCGLPMTVLEMSIGQFASLGPTALFQKFCPFFQGLGWAQCLISGVCCVYYNIIIAWTLYYFYLSFETLFLQMFSSGSHPLPWANCGKWWNTKYCVQSLTALKHLGGNGTSENDTLLADMNMTSALNASEVNITYTTASEEFWSRYILRLSSGIDQPDGIRPELALSLGIAWILIFLCLFKGVKSSGRVVYVTATFPYVVLVILCIRGVTLPGAWNGIYFYFVPEWKKLLELKVWIAAASQIFYSVGAAWGVMITFSSFNKFNHNCYRDAMILPVINCCSSVFAGIVVFSIIGFMATKAGKDVGEVIKSGAGLAFVVYPEAVVSMPFSPCWSILFFTMLLTIGVDSQFGMFETFVTAFVDTWPKLLRPRKTAFTGFVCLIMFFLGLPCVTGGGMYVLTLMDWYSATFALMITGTIECLLVGWCYGHERFIADIKLMTRTTNVHWWWPFCWRFVTPIVVLALLLATIVSHVPVTYNKYEYPGWAIAVGWTLAMTAIFPIPFYMVWNLAHTPGTLLERMATVMRPTPDYGPSRLIDRVKFRKSMNVIPGKQLYVLGVDRQENQLLELAATHQSCADLPKFVEDAHQHGEHIDSPTLTNGQKPSRGSTKKKTTKRIKVDHHKNNV